MKIIATAIAVILLAGMSYAGDYIRIDVDSIPAGAVNFEIPFFIERTCPEPERIMGVSAGFVLTATGTAEFRFAGFIPDPTAETWFFQTIVFSNGLPMTWGTYGEFLCGGAAMPPGGVPILETEHKFWDLHLDVRGEGEILIDSAFVFTAGAWRWSALTCGQGGAPDRPLFLAKDSLDVIHPILITVFAPICGDADFSGQVDVDDITFVVRFIFVGGPAPNPWHVADVDCSDQIDIDDVVYLISYIFGGGPEPCDVDGDGVPDC
jgi:hypothetical protein